MADVRTSDLPAVSLLDRYRVEGAYTDCYCIDLPRPVSQAAFVEAFFTTSLFKVERWILTLLVAKRSSDADVRQLARGDVVAFSAWMVESRTANQLLLRDFLGHTRSWLMSEAIGAAMTRLYFGSAVIPRRDAALGQPRFGLAFHLLGGFHQLYSRLLLQSAARSLQASGGSSPCGR